MSRKLIIDGNAVYELDEKETGRCTDGKEPDGREEKNSGEFERI